MKCIQVILLLAGIAFAASDQANPLSKVFDLINKLKAKIIADGEVEGKAFQKYSDYCATSARQVTHEIDTSGNLANQLSSKVNKLETDISVGETRIGEFTGAISKAESELKGATALRKQEANVFADGEKQLMTTVDTLERALSMLEREVAAGGSFAQIDESSLMSIVQTLSVVDDAAAISGDSMDKLTSLLQAGEDDADLEAGAPAAAAYGKQSGGIMQVLEDMRDKAEGQLADLRNSEQNAKNSYALLRQGLQDEVKASKKELDEEKSSKAEAAEERSSAEGNLEVTKKENKAAVEKRTNVRSNCQTVANDHETNVAARMEELKVIGQAEQILRESTGAAEERQYSFVQVAVSSTSGQRAQARQRASVTVVSMVKQLAKTHHSKSLAQLASRISTEFRYGAVRHGVDPFRKVKDLVNSMIAKLEQEAAGEATEKAYCDEEMAKTKTKKTELEDSEEKLATKIEKAVSKSSALKQEVAEIQNELSELSRETASMNAIRGETHAAHLAAKADLEQGLAGVRKALTVLQEFYGGGASAALLQEDESGDDDNMSSLMQQAVKQPAPPMAAKKSSGAGNGILGLLEVVESDMAKNLATEDAEESDGQTNYDKQTQANKITKVQKESDVKYKTQEFKSVDKSISDMEADKATQVEELNAVSDYFSKVKERCVAKPSSFEDLKARREEEIQGLKDALATIEGQALMQTHSRPRGSLRGNYLHADSDVA